MEMEIDPPLPFLSLPSSRSSSLLHSLPIELLSHITSFALSSLPPHDQSSRDVLLRSLSLVTQSWRHAAQRQLIISPVLTSSKQLGCFLSLVDRMEAGMLVESVWLQAGSLHGGRGSLQVNTAKDVRGTGEYNGNNTNFSHVYEKALERRKVEEGYWKWRVVCLAMACRRVERIKIEGMVAVGEYVLPHLSSLPLISLSLHSCFLSSPTPLILPSILRSLTLSNVELHGTPSLLSLLSSASHPNLTHLNLSHIINRNPQPPRSSLNLSIFDSITSLTSDITQSTTDFISSEHFPEVEKLELVEKEGRVEAVNDFDRTIEAIDRQVGMQMTFGLPELKELVMPKKTEWRESWEVVQMEMGRRPEVRVVWKVEE
ncbi:hypothetical protein P7C70_g8757, partial [Phenoliferia sp. Uapishka_3]